MQHQPEAQAEPLSQSDLLVTAIPAALLTSIPTESSIFQQHADQAYAST